MKKIRLKGGCYALVDEADYDWVTQWEWSRSSDYVGRYAGDDNTFIAMHRALSEHWGWDLDGKFIDHINHDKLDNRRCNLRAVTPGQNARNRKIVPICASNRFLGASEGSTGWQAIIHFEWRTYPLGTYDTQEDAALARDQAARTLDPDHFMLNLPDRPCPPGIAERIEEVLGRPGPDRAFSSYVGVYHWAGWWWAQVIYGNVLYSLGQYRSEEEAALAYDEARRSAYTAAFNLPTHRPPSAVIQQVDRFLNQHNGRRLYGISGYEGVVWDEKARVWWAEVEMGGRVYPFGPYLDAQVAALVYDAAHQLLKMPPVNFASRSYPSHILTCVIWRFLHPDFLSQQTGFAGVWLVEGHYETWISHAGKIFWVGRFRHVEEAALAYDEARRFLDLSPVNFPGIFCPYNISQHVRYRMKALGIFLIR